MGEVKIITQLKAASHFALIKLVRHGNQFGKVSNQIRIMNSNSMVDGQISV